MKEYIDKSEVNGLVQIGWSGDAIVTAILNNGVSSFPAIPIPKGATNGDMIKIMFPNAKITKQNEMMIVVDVEDNGLPHSFWKDWWDEPYKREVEEDV